MKKVTVKLILKTNREDLVDIWFDVVHALQGAGFGIDEAEMKREVEKCQGKKENQNTI